ncbi:chain A iron centre cytochrome C protein, partial [Patescibacteria group bacterium]|nr:chain A iron centre cytochrome C protein [Patescibacteria group bacterium]
SAARKERCARISADVAMKTVELLNAWKDGTYTPSHGSNAKTYDITTQTNCGDCHTDGTPPLPGV